MDLLVDARQNAAIDRQGTGHVEELDAPGITGHGECLAIGRERRRVNKVVELFDRSVCRQESRPFRGRETHVPEKEVPILDRRKPANDHRERGRRN